MNSRFWTESRQIYRHTLLQNVLPYWLDHGVDQQFGGISNVIHDDGTPINHHKFLWSQGRALWTFSAACRRYGKQPGWLHFAHHIAAYLRDHGQDENGRWMYRLDENGNILDRDISIYVDGFVLRGLAEYHALTGEEWALELAVSTWKSATARIAQPGSFGVAPYEIPPGLKTHGVAMIYSFFGFDLAEISGQEDIRTQALGFANEILHDFYVPSRDAILEFVTLDGDFSPTPAGRACVPGHAIEALWFLIYIFERCDQHDKIPACCRLIQRHLELAWDETYGGLRLALDIDNETPVFWDRADCKPWWVQVEALVATAYAHYYGEPWAQNWHEMVQTWSLQHYPLPGGEWRQWLTREGHPAPSAALPVKDPFHLPRGLMYLDELLARPDFPRD